MAANREIHSMFFSSLHIPPMPVIVQKIDGEDSSIINDEAVESSHDILAGLMEFTCNNMSYRDHNERKEKQLALQHEFYEELDSFQDIDSLNEEDLYKFFAKHTRSWMHAYTSKMTQHQASFKPYDYVASGDLIHRQMQSYAKAQCLIHSDGKKEIDIDPSVSYLTLLRMCAKWAKESALPLCEVDSEAKVTECPEGP